MSLWLMSAVALNSTQDDVEETEGYYPAEELRAPYPNILTFTTPPSIPMAREYAPYEREYGRPAEEYGAPAREYGAPAREYGAPAREYGAPAREYGAPAREYGAPAREYGAPAREYGAPAREYGAPAREYGAPAREYGAPAREYGTPAREYGVPFRSSSYQPYPARGIPPVAEYPPPTGVGAPSGAFPPTGGFPPTGPFLPTRGIPPADVSSDAIKARLYVLFEPVAVLVVGVAIFVGIRHYVLPYLIYWARSLEEDELLLEDERRSLDEPTVLNILKVVTRGVCLRRISCQLGMMAQNYTIKDLAVSAIDEERNPPRLAVIFRDTALGRVQSCEPYICRRRRLPSATAPSPTLEPDEAKHRRRKRNLPTLVEK